MEKRYCEDCKKQFQPVHEANFYCQDCQPTTIKRAVWFIITVFMLTGVITVIFLLLSEDKKSVVKTFFGLWFLIFLIVGIFRSNIKF